MNPDGTLEIENGLKFIMENIPLEVIDKALIGSAKCQRYAGMIFYNHAYFFIQSHQFRLLQSLFDFVEPGLIDPNEANCKSYEPFIKCLTNFIMTVT